MAFLEARVGEHVAVDEKSLGLRTPRKQVTPHSARALLGRFSAVETTTV
jgi:hypothetical protein